jgi:hypothetical protein
VSARRDECALNRAFMFERWDEMLVPADKGSAKASRHHE